MFRSEDAEHQTHDPGARDAVLAPQPATEQGRLRDVPDLRQGEPDAPRPGSTGSSVCQHVPIDGEGRHRRHHRQVEDLSDPLAPRRNRVADDVVGRFRTKCVEVAGEYFPCRPRQQPRHLVGPLGQLAEIRRETGPDTHDIVRPSSECRRQMRRRRSRRPRLRARRAREQAAATGSCARGAADQGTELSPCGVDPLVTLRAAIDPSSRSIATLRGCVRRGRHR